ncbi:MAG: hypothetical protein ACLU49_08330 [Agathobacter rectalis]
MNEYEKVYNYFFSFLIVIMGIKLFRNNFVAVNNTENNIKSKDVEIVDTDKIMILLK